MAISARARSTPSARRWWRRPDRGPVTRDIVLGVLSMIVWALIVVVTLKYVLVLLRADNNGEGGTLSLTALATRALGRRTPLVLLLGIIGAAMFLGDSVITPAISVLSAVEGLKLATPALRALRAAAHDRHPGRAVRGAAPRHRAGRGVLRPGHGGLVRRDRRRRRACTSRDDLARVRRDQSRTMRSASCRRTATSGWSRSARCSSRSPAARRSTPISAISAASRSRRAWFGLVLPALLINYFGQGALVLAHPEAIENPFYRLVPEALLLPLVVLATAATVIASQAVITGAYSLMRQAIQLGLLPRLAIRPHLGGVFRADLHAAREHGCCWSACCCWSRLFRTSSALASAYGIAVATTMVVDGVLGFIVIWKLWHWPAWKAALLMVPLVIVDCDVLLAPTCSSCSKAPGCRCCSASPWCC